MFRKIRMLLARRRLVAAVQHEDELRRSATYAKTVLIPKLKAELESRELEYMSEQYLKGAKRVR